MDIDALVAGLMQMATIERPEYDGDFTPDLAWELVTQFQEVVQLAAIAVAVLASKLEVAQEDLRAFEDAERSADALLFDRQF